LYERWAIVETTLKTKTEKPRRRHEGQLHHHAGDVWVGVELDDLAAHDAGERVESGRGSRQAGEP
jgi:hypothetical protein